MHALTNILEMCVNQRQVQIIARRAGDQAGPVPPTGRRQVQGLRRCDKAGGVSLAHLASSLRRLSKRPLGKGNRALRCALGLPLTSRLRP